MAHINISRSHITMTIFIDKYQCGRHTMMCVLKMTAASYQLSIIAIEITIKFTWRAHTLTHLAAGLITMAFQSAWLGGNKASMTPIKRERRALAIISAFEIHTM